MGCPRLFLDISSNNLNGQQEFLISLFFKLFFHLHTFWYFRERQTPNTRNRSRRLLQQLNADNSEFEGDNEDSVDDYLYPKTVLKKDLDL